MPLRRDGYNAHIAAWKNWWTHEVAAHLVGTCGSIPSAAEQLGHPEWEEDVDVEELDSLAFECTGCGWWCGADECNDHPETGQWVCDDCFADACGDD